MAMVIIMTVLLRELRMTVLLEIVTTIVAMLMKMSAVMMVAVRVRMVTGDSGHEDIKDGDGGNADENGGDTDDNYIGCNGDCVGVMTADVIISGSNDVTDGDDNGNGHGGNQGVGDDDHRGSGDIDNGHGAGAGDSGEVDDSNSMEMSQVMGLRLNGWINVRLVLMC